MPVGYYTAASCDMADSGGLAGFVGGSYVAASITQDDQETINWYAEVDPTEKKTDLMGPGDRQVTALYPCPGTRRSAISNHTTLPSSAFLNRVISS